MAHSDKNIVITPSIGSSTTDPRIVFSGADASLGPQNITLRVYPTNSGTLSFEGSSGQLFSISNTMSGTIFSANDVSGIPSIEVLDSGLIKLGQYSGNILLGTATDDGSKLQVRGSVRAGNNGWNSSPASTAFSHTLAANNGTNRTVNFDGNGSLPSVWWTNGSRAYGAIDSQDPGLTFWANNGSAWQKQISLGYGTVTIDTALTISSRMNMTSADIRSAATSNWTGDPGAEGKIQYHSNRWYIVADSSSNRILQFRRNDTDTSYIANNGNFVGNVTGNADTAGGLAVHTGTNNEANKIVRTDGSGYIQAGYIHSAAGNEGNNSSPSRVWGTNGSDSYLRTYLTSALNVNSASSAGSVTGLTLTSSANGINPNSVTQNQLGYNTNVSLFGQTDGGLYSSAYDSTWIHQIYGDFRTGQVMVRGKNSGTWQSWLNIPTFGKSLIFAR